MTSQRLTALFGVLLAGCVAARAQQGYRYQSAYYSRPTERTGSAVLGGTYTRNFRPTRSLDSANRSVSLLGADQFEFTHSSRSQRRPAGNVLPITEFGMQSPLSAPAGSPLTSEFARTGDSMTISGLNILMDRTVPLPGYSRDELPAINAFLYTPIPPRSEYEAYFDLKPAQADAPTPRTRIVSYSAALEDRNQFQVAANASEALAAFKAGTREQRDALSGRYPSCSDCDDALYEAGQKLQLVRDLDPNNWVVRILLAHLALERERPTQSIIYLVEAYRVNPDFPAAGPDVLDAYFGDVRSDGQSPLLLAQFRRYVRIGEINPNSLDAAVLEAYCAWGLKDRVRVQGVLLRAPGLLAKAPDAPPDAANLIEALAGVAK